MFLFIVNDEVDGNGFRVPSIPAGTSWVGHMYQKQGNVYKYLIKTPTDLTGLPGVIGPIDPEDVQAALDADNANLRGFIVDDVPSWAVRS